MADIIKTPATERPNLLGLIETLPDYVFIPDRHRFEQKAALIKKEGPENLGVIADFDRTCMLAGPDGYATSFNAVKMVFGHGSDFQQTGDMLYSHFNDREELGSLTDEELLTWWNATLGLYGWYGVDRGTLNEAARISNPRFPDTPFLCAREGFSELACLAARRNIPFMIFSAGLGDVIEESLKLHGIDMPPEMIIANRFRFDPMSGKVTGYDGNMPITSSGKNGTVIKAHDTTGLITTKSNLLLLGDSLGDAAMADGLDADTIIRAGFYLGEKTDLDRFQAYSEQYDVLVCGDHPMTSIVEILDTLTS